MELNMRGKIETTIPQRQFENIKITYEFNNAEEYLSARAKAIEDCIELKDIVTKKLKALEVIEAQKTVQKTSTPSDAWKTGTKLETPKVEHGR